MCALYSTIHTFTYMQCTVILTLKFSVTFKVWHRWEYNGHQPLAHSHIITIALGASMLLETFNYVINELMPEGSRQVVALTIVHANTSRKEFV